jgi:hypothetical protein
MRLWHAEIAVSIYVRLFSLSPEAPGFPPFPTGSGVSLLLLWPRFGGTRNPHDQKPLRSAARRVRPNRRPARLEGRTMANLKIGPLAPSIYCVHQRIAVQIAAGVDADQPDWRNRLAAVIARHLDAAAQNRTCGPDP